MNINTIGRHIVALVCVVCAAYLAINGIEYWGWFLFVGCLCAYADKL